MWVLLQQLADKLETTKDELYLIMLGKYGVFTHTVVKPNVVERVKEEWKLVGRRSGGQVTNWYCNYNVFGSSRIMIAKK